MLASAISGKPSPRCLRIACTRATSDARSGRPTFILMARKPLARLSSVCCSSASTRQIEIDAAGIAGHAGIEAAEQTPQRQTGAPRLQVPQRDVERRQRQHGRPAAPAIMQPPPDMMPDRLDVVGLAALDQLGDLAPQDVGDRAAVAADRVGVADAFGAIGIADAAGDELERRDLAMRAVGERDRQRDPIEPGLDRFDHCHLISTRLFLVRVQLGTPIGRFSSLPLPSTLPCSRLTHHASTARMRCGRAASQT